MCELRGEGGKCRGSIEWHHLIQRNKAQKSSKKVKDALNHVALRCYLCQYHHQKYGNSRWLRYEIVRRRSLTWGEKYMRDVIDNIPWDPSRPELSYDGIMSYER